MLLTSNIFSGIDEFVIAIDSIFLNSIFLSQQGSSMILLFTKVMALISLNSRTIPAKLFVDTSEDFSDTARLLVDYYYLLQPRLNI